MFKLKEILKPALAAAFLAVAPIAAGAVSITSSGVTGSFMCGGAFGTPAGTIDVLAGASFNATFDDGDAGGTYCFDLVNTSGTDAAVTLAVASVNQGGTDWGFTGGVSLDGTGPTAVIAEGVDWSESFTFLIAAGDAIVFDWTFGDAYAATPFVKPDIDFAVFATAVPLPAAGFLLLGALGGLGFARRRRKAA